MAKKNEIWTLPNVLSMLRIALIGVFVWQFVAGNRYVALGIYLLASATDILDGYLARRNNQITNLGKLLDPLADKLMLFSVLMCLLSVGLVPLWVVLVAVIKDAVLILGGYILLRRGVVVQAQMLGKVATVVFVVALVMTFLHEYVAPWDTYLQMVAVALSVMALLWYAYQVARGAFRQQK